MPDTPLPAPTYTWSIVDITNSGPTLNSQLDDPSGLTVDGVTNKVLIPAIPADVDPGVYDFTVTIEAVNNAGDTVQSTYTLLVTIVDICTTAMLSIDND